MKNHLLILRMTITACLCTAISTSYAQVFDQLIVSSSQDHIYCPNTILQNGLFVTGWNYTANDILTANVDWGDGTTETVQQPIYPGMAANGADYFSCYFQQHAYTDLGVYTITYHVTDDYGNTTTTTEEITVQQNCFDISIGVYIMGDQGCEVPSDDLEFHFTAQGMDYFATADVYYAGSGNASYEFEDLPFDLAVPMDIVIDAEGLAAMNLSISPGQDVITVEQVGPWQSFYTKVMVECEEETSFVAEAPVEINVYPVPADNFMIIESAGHILQRVSVTDMTGRVTALSLSGNRLDISVLPAGIYQLHIQTGSDTIHKNILVQH